MEKDIYQEVVRQILKDFHLVGLNPNWTENDEPEVFWSEFLHAINHLLSNEPERIRALLYRIDLDELLLNNLFESNSPKDIVEFSKHILIREMQKVANRMKGKIGE